MKCSTFFATAAVLACSAIDSVHADGATPDGGKNWSYKTNDKNVYSPSEWSLKYSTCGGTRQSPIDIVTKTEDAGGVSNTISPLQFSGECSKYKVKQLYDAFKVEAQDSTCQVAVNGNSYNYAQAHFHAPAEHTINGKAPDAEMHFVHQAADKSGYVVVGLFFEKKVGATTDPFVLNFFQQIKNVNANKTVDATLGSYVSTLESTISKGRLFNYPGSLTNPTCDETVDWWVVEKPLVISASDFDAIESDLKRIEASDDGKTARPVQPLNGRVITAY